MTDIGKILMIVGFLLLVVGVAVWGLGRLGFRGLPGDIAYQRGNIRIYFPIVSMLLLSVLLTLILWLWQWITRR